MLTIKIINKKNIIFFFNKLDINKTLTIKKFIIIHKFPITNRFIILFNKLLIVQEINENDKVY